MFLSGWEWFLQLLCRILSPLFLAVRSLLSSCEAGKSRKSLKEHREKNIFKADCKADCSYLNFFRNRRIVVISVQVCYYYYYDDDGDDDDDDDYYCCCYFQNKQSSQEI